MPTLQDFDINRWLRSTSGQIALTLFVITAFYLITQHTAHVFRVLPYGFLLLCPLMHLFMHNGHGQHGEHVSQSQLDSQAHASQNQGDTRAEHPQGHVH